MSNLKFEEILEVAQGLDTEFETLREAARRRYDLYMLQKDPYVADDIAREGKMRILSSLVRHSAHSIRADLMMNPTEFGVVPLAREDNGTISGKMIGLAENLERSLAVIWGRMNEGRRIDREIIWHQLVSPFGVMVLEMNQYEAPDQPEWMSDEDYLELSRATENEFMPWSIYLPDPMTCSWLERDGKPVVFVRRYKMLLRDLEGEYSKRTGSINPEANLKLDGNQFKWVSDDYTRDSSMVKGGFLEVEMLWLDDGENIYHVCLNPGSKSGQLLWMCPNPTGRVTAFIVPGNLTPSREPHNRYEPFLLSLMNSVSTMNDLRSTRATAARNLAGPHTYIALDPEIVKQYMARGEKLPTSVRWRKNETHYLLGKVETMPSELSPDWDKIEQAVNEELQLYTPSQFVNVVDPAVLKAATATSILHAAEAGVRIYGPLMSSYDSSIRDVMESIVRSVRMLYAERSFSMWSTGEEVAHGKPLARGKVYSFNTDAVNFPHKIMVKTRGMSQAQAAAQYDLALRQWVLPDGSKGPATRRDLIDAANYTDSTAQIMALAQEDILGEVTPWIKQLAIQSIRDQVLLDSGIDLPLGNPGADAGAQPSAIPGGAQRMDAPMVTGAEGGSSPDMMMQ